MNQKPELSLSHTEPIRPPNTPPSSPLLFRVAVISCLLNRRRSSAPYPDHFRSSSLDILAVLVVVLSPGVPPVEPGQQRGDQAVGDNGSADNEAADQPDLLAPFVKAPNLALRSREPLREASSFWCPALPVLELHRDAPVSPGR